MCWRAFTHYRPTLTISSFNPPSKMSYGLDIPSFTELWHLDARVWDAIAEIVGLAPIQRLLMTGSKRLSEFLRTLTFKRISVSLHRMCPLDTDTVSNLAPRFRVFNQLRTLSLTLYFERLMPEWLYLAAQMVSSRDDPTYLGGILTGIDYSITRTALERIPWIRNWFVMKGHATLVRTCLDHGEAGYFASLQTMRVVVDAPSLWTQKLNAHSNLWNASTPWLGTLDQHYHVPSRTSIDSKSSKKCLQSSRGSGSYNRVCNAEKCPAESVCPSNISTEISCERLIPSYPFNTDTLIWLSRLKLEDYTVAVSGMLELNLCSAPQLTTFSFSFTCRANDHQKPLTIKIMSESKMKKLKVHNLWFSSANGDKPPPPSGQASFGLCTLGSPGIRLLSLVGVAWAPYQRIHRKQLHLLEELHLEHCVLGECAWELRWPPNLRRLSLVNVYIAPEPHLNHDEWQNALSKDVPRPEEFLGSLSPMALPVDLRTLTISGNTNGEEVDGITSDVTTKWSAVALSKRIKHKPRDYSVLSAGGYRAEDMIVPYLRITRATLQGKNLPCRKLLKLQLRNGSLLLPQALPLMPYSLQKISSVLPKSHTFAMSKSLPKNLVNEWKDHDIFCPAAQNLKNFHVSRIFWTYLLPYNVIEDRDIIIDPLHRKKSLKIVCLLNWFLRSALLQVRSLSEECYPEDFASMDSWAMLYMLSRYWKKWTECGKFHCHWILATPIPYEIEGLVWEFSEHHERVEIVEKMEKRSAAAREARRLLKLKPKIERQRLEAEEKDNQANKPKIKAIDSPIEISLESEYVTKKRPGSVTAVLVPAPEIKNTTVGFNDFVNFKDVSWPMVLQNLLRLELKAIPFRELRQLQSAHLPLLEHLLITVSLPKHLSVNDRCFFALEMFQSPLQELVFYAIDGFLLLPAAPRRYISTRDLKKLVTCNSMSDIEIAAFPELATVTILPFQSKDVHAPTSIDRGPVHANQDSMADAYFAKYLQIRREARRQEVLRSGSKPSKFSSQPISPEVQKLFKPAIGSGKREIPKTGASYLDDTRNKQHYFHFPKPSTFIFTGATCFLPSPPDLAAKGKVSNRITGTLGRLGRWFSAGYVDPSLIPASSPQQAPLASSPGTEVLTSLNWSSQDANLANSSDSFLSSTTDSYRSTESLPALIPALEPEEVSIFGPATISSSASNIPEICASKSFKSPKDGKPQTQKDKSKKDTATITLQTLIQRALPSNQKTHFKRFTLSPDLSRLTIPDHVTTIDLTDPVDLDATPAKARKINKSSGPTHPPFWHYYSDSTISIDIEKIKLPRSLTQLKLMAIEPIKAEDLIRALPRSLLVLHVYNQSGDANVPWDMFQHPTMLPHLLEDIYAPHILILPELSRITPDWFPSTLWRLICSGIPPHASQLPKTLKIATIGGKSIFPVRVTVESHPSPRSHHRGKSSA